MKNNDLFYNEPREKLMHLDIVLADCFLVTPNRYLCFCRLPTSRAASPPYGRLRCLHASHVGTLIINIRFGTSLSPFGVLLVDIFVCFLFWSFSGIIIVVVIAPQGDAFPMETEVSHCIAAAFTGM